MAQGIHVSCPCLQKFLALMSNLIPKELLNVLSSKVSPCSSVRWGSIPTLVQHLSSSFVKTEEVSHVLMPMADKPTFLARQYMDDVGSFSTNTVTGDVCDWYVVAKSQCISELRFIEGEAQFLQRKCREPATHSSILCSFDELKCILGKRFVCVVAFPRVLLIYVRCVS